MSAMAFDEFIAGDRIAEIPKIFRSGVVPPEFLPVTTEDEAAVSLLQETFWPITNEMVVSNAERLRQLLPVERLCLVLARQALPVLRRASKTNGGDVARELRTVASFIHFCLKAEARQGRRPFTEEAIYQDISKRQLWLVHLWPSAKSRATVTFGDVRKWLDGTFLLLPLKLHAYWFLHPISPSEMHQKALDWMLGYESCPDWFLASEMRRATNRGDEDMMEHLTTGWGRLPSIGSAEKPHFSSENRADFKMRYPFGEASIDAGWERAVNPLSWLRVVARNKVRQRSTQDEAEYIKAARSKCEIESLDTINLEEIAEDPCEVILGRRYTQASVAEMKAAAAKDPDLAAYVNALAENPKWKRRSLWAHLGWDPSHGQAVDRKYRRLRQKLRDNGAGMEWRMMPTLGVSPSQTAYFETLADGTRGRECGVWQHRPLKIGEK